MRENGLWRLTLVVLFALAGGLALVSWAGLAESPWRLGALPIGLVVLVGLFGSYALAKTREIAELRGLVRGLEQRATTQPAVGQVEKLFDMVQRSQQGYRELIDTFDDLLFSLSDTGEILAANRSFADVLGHSFSELVGRRLDEFVDLGDGTGRAAAEKALPRFLERRHWSGVLRVYLKRDSSIRYFECTLHTPGAQRPKTKAFSVLARDVTKERENEARFTELFETLQEGVYVAGADGKFESVNPALARLLGYDQREEMLDHPLSDFVLEREQWETAAAPNNAIRRDSRARSHAAPARWFRGRLSARGCARSRHGGAGSPPARYLTRHYGAPRNGAATAPRAGIRAPSGRKLSGPCRGHRSGRPLHVRKSPIT